MRTSAASRTSSCEPIFSEPHSTKQIEDLIGWTLETDAETLIAANSGLGAGLTVAQVREQIRPVLDAIDCPALVIHGSNDAVAPVEWGVALAEELGSELMVLDGCGHLPTGRDPVKVNLADPRVRRPRASSRRRGERYGPAHSRVASGRCSCRHPSASATPNAMSRSPTSCACLHPDLEIEWLAQDPVTRVLDARGESIHPASRFLASESRHIESESAEHDLHCFQAFRRMDEILVANFHVFDDVVTDSQYDLWIGDEAWDIDYFLHENPERKRAAFCWLTDFVGWLPMPDGGDHEAMLTADYNAEMIEQVGRFGRIRDRSVFVGNPDDIVPLSFGADLPMIRDWTEHNFDFAGYVTGFDPVGLCRP